MLAHAALHAMHGFQMASVSAVARNVDTDFAYSDHNPVLLTFELGVDNR